MRLFAKVMIVLAVAVAVVSFFFTHDYAADRGILRNIVDGRIYLTRECSQQVTFLPLQPPMPKALIQSDPVNHWWSCDVEVPYVWILGGSVVVVVVALAVLS